MLPNTIVLPVDVLDNGTTVDKTYTRDDAFPNRAVYVAADHTLAVRSLLNTYRTQPKPSGNFPGVAKGSMKLTQDYVVLGKDRTTEVVAGGIVEYSSSMPVGCTTAQHVEMLQRMIALLKHDVALLVTEKNQY